MRVRIQRCAFILFLTAILMCVESAGAQEGLTEVSLDQALSVPAEQLAEGYLVVKYTISLARLSQHGATVQTSLDDAGVVINSDNADVYLRSLENRLNLYEKAIRRRGFIRLAQAYSAKADEPCEKVGIFSFPTLCEQSEFHITLSQGKLIHRGVVVESTVVVEHSANPEVYLFGKATADRLVFDARISGFTSVMHPVKCRVVLKKTDRNDKTFALAYLGRARGQMSRDETEKALADLAESVRIDPDFAPAYAIRSQVFSKANDARFRDGERAINDATRACELTNWERWEYLHPLAAAHAENGDFQLAIKWVNEALKSAPALERSELREELEWYRQKKPLRFEVDPIGGDSPDSDSSDPPIDATDWFDRGKSKYDQGEYGECISDFTEAIRLDQGVPSAYFHRGSAFRRTNEADKAIDDYSEAIRLDPTYVSALIGRAIAWNRKGDREQAIKDYTEAIRLDPDDAWVYASRGNARRVTGEYDQAIDDYDEAMRLDPDYAWAYNELAWVLATCPEARYRDGRRAVELGNKACDLSGWQHDKIVTLAAAYAESGDFEQAIRWQEKATASAPESEQETYRSRIALYKSGKPYRDKLDH